MYGMPTRVRDLYLGYQHQQGGEEYAREWRTIDRDIDLGVFEHAPGAVVVKDKYQHRCVGFTGPLGDFRFGTKKHPSVLRPEASLSEPFWMLQCSECGAWNRFDEAPAEGGCRACGAALEVEKAKECRTPYGFRTDFFPQPIEAQELATGRYRSICAEGREVELVPKDPTETNVRLRFQPQSRTYRLNRGPRTEDDPLGQGFDAVEGTWKIGRYTKLENQLIAYDRESNLMASGRDFDPEASSTGIANFWLAAPKTTDALFLAPARISQGLRIHRVGGKDQGGVTSVRAAALSATYLLVNRAALELDIDPEEFDVIEPRPYAPDGITVPLLEITDHLVNGAGFCERLARQDASGEPMIVRLIRSMVRDGGEYPLREFLGDPADPRSHPKTCDQACYLCLHRYGNQMYHGLLDWRLGLAFLATLDDVGFDCGFTRGLDVKGAPPFLADWLDIARRYAEEMVRRFGGEVSLDGVLPAFRFDTKVPHWAIVVHPLWETQGELRGLVKTAFDAYRGSSAKVEFVDTFELTRRQVTVYEELQRAWNTR
jgi:hypothetical protein